MPNQTIGNDLDVTPEMLEAGSAVVCRLNADLFETTSETALNELLRCVFLAMGSRCLADDGDRNGI